MEYVQCVVRCFIALSFCRTTCHWSVAAAGVCRAPKAAKFAVGIHPAWHDTTICCAPWCSASRYSACASQLCWLLSFSSSASARSDKRLSLLQCKLHPSHGLTCMLPTSLLQKLCFFPEKEGRRFFRNSGHTAEFYMVPTLIRRQRELC